VNENSSNRETPATLKAKPLLSVIVPTLNASRTLPDCLRSIRSQRFDQDRIEIIVADGGSSDDTLDIARRHGVRLIVPNRLVTGEAGKSAGIAASTGELLALIDSDNVLDDPDWLSRMTAPFADPSICASEPILYTVRSSDPAMTRYFALLGMNDPLCLFLGNYDRYSHVTGRWTDMPVTTHDRGDYLKVTLSPETLPTIGANGFVMRRSLLDHVSWTPYFFDIDIMQQAIQAGHTNIAKVKCGIVHLYGRGLGDFARKQRRRINDFLFFAKSNRRTYPWTRQRRLGIVLFVASCLTVLPLAVQALRGFTRRPDRAWWFHIPACWITLAVYGSAAIERVITGRAAQTNRGQWRQ
jgi:glycosyltransferase involved in cell wall biosynthesis